MDVYTLIGLVVVAALAFLLAITVIALVLAYFVAKRKQFFFPQFVLLVLDTLSFPSKKIISFLGGNERMVENVSIEIRNMLWKEKYRKTPFNERIILLPQCLRNIECKAKLDPIEGIKCLKCGKCKIKDITEKAERLDYKGVYTVPGGGFAKRVLKRVKPKAVLGIACWYELNWGMLEASNARIPNQGITLLRDGCVNTDADFEEIMELIELK